MTGLPIETIKAIFDYLTYGNRSRTPDPALQPIISLGADKITIPPILLLSSNYPRNLLALHARISPDSFDRQSYLFEREMINRVKQIVQAAYPLSRFNTYLPGPRSVGEVDMLAIDETSKTILIGELRWLLTPGDSREVINRKKVCSEKVEQLRRKAEAANNVLSEILNSLALQNPDFELGQWSILGIVILDGFIAATNERQRFPLVLIDQFLMAAAEFKSLKLLHYFFSCSDWLPQKDVHFSTAEVTVDFGSQRLQWSSIRMSLDVPYIKDHFQNLLIRSKLT